MEVCGWNGAADKDPSALAWLGNESSHQLSHSACDTHDFSATWSAS